MSAKGTIHDPVWGDGADARAFVERLGVDPDRVYRVVLDIRADAVAVAYVEMYASRQALEVLTNSPKGLEVRVVDKAAGEHPGEVGVG